MYTHSPRSDIDLTREEIFDVLSNDRRRCTLHFLKQQEDEWISFGAIVDHVTAWESDAPINQLDSSTRKTVYTSLRQSHIPKLAESGIIEFNRSTSQVRLTPAAREVQMYLEFVPSNDIPWHHYYLGLTTIVGTIATATWFEIYPFAALEWSLFIAITIIVLAISAVLHTRFARMNRLGSHALYTVGEQ